MDRHHQQQQQQQYGSFPYDSDSLFVEPYYQQVIYISLKKIFIILCDKNF
jgi:hypothetical protein